MQITIDIFSLIFGLFIGGAVALFATIYTLYDERWSTGFGSGWDAHRKFMEKKGRKEEV